MQGVKRAVFVDLSGPNAGVYGINWAISAIVWDRPAPYECENGASFSESSGQQVGNWHVVALLLSGKQNS